MGDEGDGSRREQGQLDELVDWPETEHAPVTEEELAEAEGKEIEHAHAERARAERVTEQQAGRERHVA